jgi:hypothetical protein
MSDSPFLLRHKRMLQYLLKAGLVPLFGIGAFKIGMSGLSILDAGGYSDRHGRLITAVSDPIGLLGSVRKHHFHSFVSCLCLCCFSSHTFPSEQRANSLERQAEGSSRTKSFRYQTDGARA